MPFGDAGGSPYRLLGMHACATAPFRMPLVSYQVPGGRGAGRFAYALGRAPPKKNSQTRILEREKKVLRFSKITPAQERLLPTIVELGLKPLRNVSVVAVSFDVEKAERGRMFAWPAHGLRHR